MAQRLARTPVAVLGPASSQGASAQGNEGCQGATGKSGDGATVIVMPRATAPVD